MTATFDNVDIERLRQRRTVKWTLYGPDVLAAWELRRAQLGGDVWVVPGDRG